MGDPGKSIKILLWVSALIVLPAAASPDAGVPNTFGFASTLVSSGEFIAWAERQVCQGTSPAVLLGWEPVPGAIGSYRVFRTDGEYAAVVDPLSEGYTHLVATGLDYDQNYNFFVTAETMTGTAYSDIIRVYAVNQDCLKGTFSNQPPGPFMPWHEPFFCQDGQPAVMIRWSAPSGVEAYTLERLTPSGGTDRLVEGLTGNAFLDDEVLTPGIEHVYIMTAVNPFGSWRTSFRYSLSVYPPPDVCSADGLPGAFTLAAGDPFCQNGAPAVPLTFTQSAGADSLYRIRASGPVGTDGSARVTRSGSGPYTYTYEGLQAGRPYRFFVIATDPADPGLVRYSNEVHVRVPLSVCGSFTSPPDTYSMDPISVTSTSAIIRATVHPNGSFTEAHFQWGETSGYGFATPTLDLGATTLSRYLSNLVIGLSCNTEYHFRATATNPFLTTFGDDTTFTTLPCDSCGPDHLLLDNLLITDAQSHEACQSIQIGPDTEVLLGGALHVTAPRIVIAPGFSVATGGSFRAGRQ